MRALTDFEVQLCEQVLNLNAPEEHWEKLARFLAQPHIADWLIERSLATPYTHIGGYMERNWLLNPYPLSEEERKTAAYQHLSSSRVHHILRCDNDRHKHDHPWRARTIILKGCYAEERIDRRGGTYTRIRAAGDTATLNFGEYHRITEVSEGGVWTLFVTGEYQGTWGFLVDGVKVPWREYLGVEP